MNGAVECPRCGHDLQCARCLFDVAESSWQYVPFNDAAIERVARAICEAIQVLPWDQLGGDAIDECRAAASAALRAAGETDR